MTTATTTTTPAAPAAPPPPADAAPSDTSALAQAGVDSKTTETAKPAETVKPSEPAALELKLPEGMQLEAAQLDGFKKLAAELKLDSAGASKVLEQVAAIDKARAEAGEKSFVEQDKKWAAEWQSDKELGGAKSKETVTDIRRAFTHFKADEARSVLMAAGLGNHPAVVRAFAAIGRALRDDTIANTASSSGSSKPKTDAEIFYGTPPTTDSAA